MGLGFIYDYVVTHNFCIRHFVRREYAFASGTNHRTGESTSIEREFRIAGLDDPGAGHTKLYPYIPARGWPCCL